jgi:hypothetical protein
MFTHVVETKWYGSGRKFSKRKVQLFTGAEEVDKYIDAEILKVDPDVVEKLFRVWPITNPDPVKRLTWKYTATERQHARKDIYLAEQSV